MNRSEPAVQSNNRILFLDPNRIRSSENVVIRTHPPEEQQIVLSADRPWESRFIAFYVSVLKEEETYRMWYTCRDQEGHGFLAYAESRDGMAWVKPELGIVEYNGDRRNNLLDIRALEGNVFIDPWAPPNAKYKYVTTIYKKGIYVYTSPDGIHWTREREPFLPFMADSQCITFPDQREGVYRIYLRGWDRIHHTSGYQRTVVYAETTDLMTGLGISPGEDAYYPWKGMNIPALSKELPAVLWPDEWEKDTAGFYTMAACAYPLDPAYYIAFPALLSHQTGRTDVICVGSTDGVNWHRYDRKPYWQPGMEASQTQGMVYAGYGMFRQGSQLWHYGAGFRTNHGSNAGRHYDGSIVLLKQRLDGFVSAATDYQGGEFTTTPMVCTGDRLIVNLDTGGAGYARIGVLDEQGNDIDGLTIEQCDLIQANHVEYVVTWAGKADLAPLLGKSVQLKVVSASCNVYSLRFDFDSVAL